MIERIAEEFLNDYSYVRAGNEFFKAGDTDNAIQEYKNALEINPDNAEAHLKLAQKSGDVTLAKEIERWLGLYRQAEDTSNQSNRQ